MILKLLSRHSPGYKGLIDYLLKEGKGEENEKPEPYLHNIRGANSNQWIRQLYENEAMRQRQRKDQVYFTHAIMSFNKLDNEKINKDMLKDMSKKFIELRGKEGMYLSCSHHDREHTHIHFLISGLEFRTGKSFWMSQKELKDLKIELQNYQIEKYPELNNSLPNHGLGKEYLSPEEYAAKTRNSKTYKKEQLMQKVNLALTQSKSQDEFLNILRDNGLHHYERGGRAYGVVMDGKNYRFSTLGVDANFLELSENKSQEQQALEEIRSIRESNQEKEESLEQDSDSETDGKTEPDSDPVQEL